MSLRERFAGGIPAQAALVAIATVALGIRFIRIGSESLWLDEAFSIWASQQSMSQMMATAKWDPHPPLHYLLLKVWIGWFGTSEVALRALSAVAGAGSVWAIGQLFFAVRHQQAGLYASALLAFSPLHIAYSQETRSYALFFLVATLATATLLRAMRDPRPHNLAFYAMTATLTFYTHVYSVFLFAAHALIYVGTRWFAPDQNILTVRTLATVYGVVGLLCAPWAFFLLDQTQSGAASWIPRPTFETLGRSFPLLAGSALLLAAMLALGIVAAIHLRRPQTGAERILILAAVVLAVAFPLGAALVSWNWKPIYLLRATIPAIIGLVAIAALGIARLPDRLRVPALALLLVASAMPMYEQLADVEKEDWRAAVGRVNRGAQPGDIVILDAGFTRHVYDYYTNRTDVVVLQAPDNAAAIAPWIAAQTATLKEGGRVWHLEAHSRDVHELIPKTLSADRVHSFKAQHWGIWVSGWDVNQTIPAIP